MARIHREKFQTPPVTFFIRSAVPGHPRSGAIKYLRRYNMAVEVVAPMPGTIAEILVEVGDAVNADDELIILEAMKMENPIMAPSSGKVAEIKVAEKDKVDTNQVLVVLE
jgi:biotin carboxyl carrier protein